MGANDPTVDGDDAGSASPALDVSATGGQIGRFQISGLIGSGGLGIVLAGRDPDLDRAVAIKVLRSHRRRDRLLREAQAMARVTHPNTITVYEIGRAGDEMFIAMELVEGVSLRAWLAARDRPWRDIVTVFIGAGRGLLAIHQAGLVHRDFKPDNVMVRGDGRPQVGDFGLAGDGVVPDIDGASTAPGMSLSVHGEVIGTPAFMAPEQWRGAAVDARADQFAFSVSLWTALFGAPPFVDDDLATLRAAVLAGERRPRPPHPAPAELVSALERGLSADPSARWPSLELLLARLERGLGARRRRAVFAGGIVAAIGVTAGVAVARRPNAAPDVCPVPTAQLAAVWSATRADLLRTHMRAIDPVHGEARFAATARIVDPFLTSWRTMRVDTCRATRVRGEQSDTLLDLRIRCLDARLAELAAGLRYLDRATSPPDLDNAQRGLLRVTPVSACRDDATLVRVLTQPTDPAARALVDDVTARLTEIDAAYRASQMHGLAARGEAALADARRTGHAPTLAAALESAGNLADAEARNEPDLAYLKELTQVAAAAGDAAIEARAWLGLISSTVEHHPDEGLTLVPAAAAAIVRAGDPVDLRVRLLRTQAALHNRGDGARLAAAELAEARRLIDATPERSPALDYALGTVLFEQGNTADELGTDDAERYYREAITVYRRTFGPDSQLEAHCYHNLSDSLSQQRRLDDALAAITEAIRMTRAGTGASPRLASDIAMRAMLLDNAGHGADAVVAYEEAIAMFRAHVGPDDLGPAAAMVGYANALARVGRVADAERAFAEVIALYERTGAHTVNLPIALFNRAELGRHAGRCPDAIPQYRRAATLVTEWKGPASPLLGYPLVGEAQCHIVLGEHRQAIAQLEQAAPLVKGDPLRAAMREAWLGRALVESRQDPRKGLARARAARTAMAAITNDPEAPGELRDLDAWLASR